MNDPIELRAKYSEVARLKRQIEYLRSLKKPGTLHPSLRKSTINSKSLGGGNHKRLIATNITPPRIVTNPRAALVRTYTAKTRAMDRIHIHNHSYAVDKVRDVLIPLTSGSTLVPGECHWNNRTYLPRPYGFLVPKENVTKPLPEPICQFYSQYGKCNKGNTCQYQHIQKTIRGCKFATIGQCNQQNCLFNHDLNACNTPLCKYHLNFKCTNNKCRFIHRIPPGFRDPGVDIWLCRSFAINGYCERGAKCRFLHVYECPDFEELGFCKAGVKCKLPHNMNKFVQARMVNDETQDVVIDDFHQSDKKVVNSYTVDPKWLYEKDENTFYIDVGDEEDKSELDDDDDDINNNKEDSTLKHDYIGL